MIKISRNHNITIARMVLVTTLVSMAILALVACGGSNTAESTPQPTLVAPTVATVATATPDMMGMPDMPPMPTAPAAVSTAGTGPSDSATPTQAPDGQSGATTEIQGTLKEWSITLSQQEAPAGKIRFTVTNAGQSMHNFSINGSSGELAATRTFTGSEGPQTLEVELQPGTYTIICSLPGHAARGQQTTLVVK